MTSADMDFEKSSRLPSGNGRDGISGVEHLENRDGAGMLIRLANGECWLGTFLVAATDIGICAVLLGDDRAALARDLGERFPAAELRAGGEVAERMASKVADFLEAPRRGLDLPLDPRGTAFQKRVWQALREVPPGSTTSYSEVAERIGAPRESYAVGKACAANMIAVAIPCHRVVRKDGALAGYRWGVSRKRALLKREAVA